MFSRYVLPVWWHPPSLQDKDLKQYMDDCGNIMSMHNVKVRMTLDIICFVVSFSFSVKNPCALLFPLFCAFSRDEPAKLHFQYEVSFLWPLIKHFQEPFNWQPKSLFSSLLSEKVQPSWIQKSVKNNALCRDLLIKVIITELLLIYLCRSSCSRFCEGCRIVIRGRFSTGTWSPRTSSSTREENSNWLILVRGAGIFLMSLL